MHQGDNPEPNWLLRNWKWLVPTTVVVGFGVILGGIAAIFMLVFGVIRSSDAYLMAVETASSSPAVIELIGEPIEEGFFMTGNMNTNGSSGHADLTIPLSGPKGDAILHVVASKTDNQWSFESLKIESKDTDHRMDLLAEAARPPSMPDSPPFKTFRESTAEKFHVGETIVIRHDEDQLQLVFTEILQTDRQESATYAYTLKRNGETDQGVVTIAQSFIIETTDGRRHITPTGGSRLLQHGTIELSWSYHSADEFHLHFRPGQQLLLKEE